MTLFEESSFDHMPDQLLQVHCPTCDELVMLEPVDVWLDTSGEYFRFTCPECGQGVAKPATAKAVELLKASGVKDVEEIVKDEMQELERGAT